MSNIYDKEITKDNKTFKKVALGYIRADKSPCDCCDEDKVLATIWPLCGDALCICKDCLTKIVDEF